MRLAARVPSLLVVRCALESDKGTGMGEMWSVWRGCDAVVVKPYRVGDHGLLLAAQEGWEREMPRAEGRRRIILRIQPCSTRIM